MYTLKLDAATLSRIGDMLAEKPYKDVANIILNIQQQVTAQETQEREAAAEVAAAATPAEAG